MAKNVLVFNCAIGRNPLALLAALDLFHHDIDIDYFFSCPFKQERPHLYTKIPALSEFLESPPANLPAPESWQETILQSWRYLCKQNGASPPIQSEIFPSVIAALNRLREMARDSSDLQFNVLVTGSLYLVGDTLDAVDYPVA